MPADPYYPAAALPLRSGSPPYRHGVPGIGAMTLTFLLAAALPISAGVVLFGWEALRVLAISAATALLIEAAFNLLARRSRAWSEGHALLMSILFACTLPPMVDWRVIVFGSAVVVAVGQSLSGGMGNYYWHPAALARVLVQLFCHQQVTPEQWPVLAPGRLIWGDLNLTHPLPPLHTWSSPAMPEGAEAWLVTRPLDVLRGVFEGGAGRSSPQVLAETIRDALPPWPDVFLGLTGGTIGTACVLAILLAGVLLLWRGFVRWPAVVAALLCAAVLAAVLPIHIRGENGTLEHYWLPALAVWQGLPVGLLYVCYQLTAGELLLVLLLLAADPTSSPLTTRGHVLFGLLIGSAGMFLHVAVGLPAAAYWALLLANTLVPLIDRRTRRPVLGTRII